MANPIAKQARRIFKAAVVAASMGGFAASATDAAPVTYDLRIATGDPKFKVVTTGQVVSLDLFVILNDGGMNNDYWDDGMWFSFGSFVSSDGGLLGNIRGDTTTKTVVNVAPPFNTGQSQSGYRDDLDGDDDYDVGSLLQTTSPTPTPWFAAYSPGNNHSGDTWDSSLISRDTEDADEDGNTTEKLPSGPVPSPGGPTVFRIARPTVTITGNSDSMEINYLPRVKTDSADSSRRLHSFQIDGVLYDLNGNGDNPFTFDVTENDLAVLDPVTLAIPEPTTLALIGLPGVAVLRRRRS